MDQEVRDVLQRVTEIQYNIGVLLEQLERRIVILEVLMRVKGSPVSPDEPSEPA